VEIAGLRGGWLRQLDAATARKFKMITENLHLDDKPFQA
jgi:hypothetical protein